MMKRGEEQKPYTPAAAVEKHRQVPPRFTPEALWQVMRRQVALYTGMESSSVPQDTALELLASVRFCVQTAVDARAAGEGETLAGWLLAGQRVLYTRAEQVRRLQKAALAARLPLDNAPYRDALTETQRFITWYDIRFFAHQIPCMIDYPLALPVDTDKQGADYIADWLRRRLWEDRLCGCFSSSEVTAVLNRFNASWRHMPLNLFEPVFAAALGKALLHGDVNGLVIHPEERNALWAQYASGEAEDLRAKLARATGQLCNRLRMWASGQRAYYTACAAALAPRVQAADKCGFMRIF